MTQESQEKGFLGDFGLLGSALWRQETRGICVCKRAVSRLAVSLIKIEIVVVFFPSSLNVQHSTLCKWCHDLT